MSARTEGAACPEGHVCCDESPADEMESHSHFLNADECGQCRRVREERAADLDIDDFIPPTGAA